MKITRIKMKEGCRYSNNLLEIDELYVIGCTRPGFYKKADIYDFVKNNPGVIKVDRWPYPNVVPALSVYGEKYVKSTPNAYWHDNLLSLPRE